MGARWGRARVGACPSLLENNFVSLLRVFFVTFFSKLGPFYNVLLFMGDLFYYVGGFFCPYIGNLFLTCPRPPTKISAGAYE